MRTERIEAGMRAGNLSWWELELPSENVFFDGSYVNELATNAMKYGFDTEMEEPGFTVELNRENDSYVLTVSNNGRPFPEDIQLDNPQTLGLRRRQHESGMFGACGRVSESVALFVVS